MMMWVRFCWNLWFYFQMIILCSHYSHNNNNLKLLYNRKFAYIAWYHEFGLSFLRFISLYFAKVQGEEIFTLKYKIFINVRGFKFNFCKILRGGVQKSEEKFEFFKNTSCAMLNLQLTSIQLIIWSIFCHFESKWWN